MGFDISYTDKEITPWGRMVLLRQMMEKLELCKTIEGQRDLAQPGSNRRYSASTVIEGFIDPAIHQWIQRFGKVKIFIVSRDIVKYVHR